MAGYFRLFKRPEVSTPRGDDVLSLLQNSSPRKRFSVATVSTSGLPDERLSLTGSCLPKRRVSTASEYTDVVTLDISLSGRESVTCETPIMKQLTPNMCTAQLTPNASRMCTDKVGFSCEAQTSMLTSFDADKKAEHLAKAYALCPAYEKLLEECVRVREETSRIDSFSECNWPAGVNLFHLAAKKNNARLLKMLFQFCPRGDIHAVDDFGKKPVDYTCANKKDSVQNEFVFLMGCISPPDAMIEAAYLEKKTGIKSGWKLVRGSTKENVVPDDVVQYANEADEKIATRGERPANMLVAEEVQELISEDYKKLFKKGALKAGCPESWEAVGHNNQWPHGQSLLHWAARNGKDEICRFCVWEFLVDPRDDDSAGRSAIAHAKLTKHSKLAKKLAGKTSWGNCARASKASKNK